MRECSLCCFACSLLSALAPRPANDPAAKYAAQLLPFQNMSGIADEGSPSSQPPPAPAPLLQFRRRGMQPSETSTIPEESLAERGAVANTCVQDLTHETEAISDGGSRFHDEEKERTSGHLATCLGDVGAAKPPTPDVRIESPTKYLAVLGQVSTTWPLLETVDFSSERQQCGTSEINLGLSCGFVY